MVDQPQPDQPDRRGIILTLDKIFLGMTRNWLLVISAIIGIYTAMPFVAPIAMHAGATGVGETIYRIYSPMCHQYVFRSWFLFGEQAVYPRERAGTNYEYTFEDAAADEPAFAQVPDIHDLDGYLSLAAKRFRGSERMGYKVALCQRDIATYLTLTLFGPVMLILKRLGVKIPYLPFWAYILIALAPMGLDGFSQLFANPPFNGFGIALYPIRESTPFLRTLTGAMFGLGNAWLAYPYIDDSMEETEEMIVNKLTQAGVLQSTEAQAGD